MKLIAHRGASIEAQENTIESLNLGAKIGAYAVECDLRLTKDDKFIIFHDDDLKRMANNDYCVKDITYLQMKEILGKNNLKLTTLDEIIEEYNGNSYILFDFANLSIENYSKENVYGAKPYALNDEFFKMLLKLPFKVICGVHTVFEAKAASKYFPKEQILAFMENKTVYEEYYKAGAGNIRLWEQWISDITPEDVKKKCPDAEVWIMSYTEETQLNGNIESLNKFKELGADGVLLNDIRMAVKWKESN